jgi:hypothetical protein
MSNYVEIAYCYRELFGHNLFMRFISLQTILLDHRVHFSGPRRAQVCLRLKKEMRKQAGLKSGDPKDLPTKTTPLLLNRENSAKRIKQHSFSESHAGRSDDEIITSVSNQNHFQSGPLQRNEQICDRMGTSSDHHVFTSPGET